VAKRIPMTQSSYVKDVWREPARARDAFVVLLAVVTGATDATSFLKLGGAFTSVMTGNMVLLGIAVGRHSGSLATHTGLAFGGYVLGSLFGARIAGHATRSDSLWPQRITTALFAELILFAAFTVGFEVGGGHPIGSLASTLLTLNAVALGVQSSAVLRFGISGLSTTYLTGTLTTVFARLTHHEGLKGHGRHILLLIALVVGAVLGSVLSVQVPRAEPVLQLGLLGIVVVAVSSRGFKLSVQSAQAVPTATHDKGK
jgi:uncharacterized membrane protein YoaK (UPF0700 family)